jgi:hypothetical protein
MLSASLFRRLAALVLVLSILTTPGTWAARPAAKVIGPAKAAEPASATFLGRAWNLLAVIWAREGCNIDPNGRCVPHPPTEPVVTPLTGESGCNIDPDGRCHL